MSYPWLFPVAPLPRLVLAPLHPVMTHMAEEDSAFLNPLGSDSEDGTHCRGYSLIILTNSVVCLPLIPHFGSCNPRSTQRSLFSELCITRQTRKLKVLELSPLSILSATDPLGSQKTEMSQSQTSEAWGGGGMSQTIEASDTVYRIYN